MTAERHAQRSLEMYAALPPKDRTYHAENGARADLAGARVLHGNPEGAREALLPVFALPPARRLAGIWAGWTGCVTSSASASSVPLLRPAGSLASAVSEVAA